MTVEIYAPPLSQTADTLVIVEWLKKVGDPIVKGEVLFKVETDKAVLEVESPTSGILSAILAGAGEEVKVRSVIGSIAEPGEAVGEVSSNVTKSLREITTPPEPPLAAVGPGGEALPPERQNRLFASPRARQLAVLKGVPLEDLRGQGTGVGGLIVERDVNTYLDSRKAKPRITPLARRMAETTGVDLSKVTPSGPGGAITKADIEASSGVVSRAPLVGSIPLESKPTPAIRLTPTRKTIARRMQESHQLSAPVTYLSEVDATRLVKLRKRILAKLPEGDVRTTYTDFLIYLTCRALAGHPALNATLLGDTLGLHSSVHLALAVDTARGLIAPVIRDADRMGVTEIARMRSELVSRALQGTISPEELNGGTFTLTNLGARGIDFFTPLINPPQVAILGVGRIREAPLVRKGKVRVRKALGLALTCDHRVVDGGPAARFLQDLCKFIETPDLIWL
jgi:pyruvate dehydrogenase E2 component (dihydrolipoamide acetyltransferase)